MVEKGEIKKEDAWKVLEDITNMDSENFYTFLNEL
jgi:polyhydroxyalkanoate synthesis regulator phasin